MAKPNLALIPATIGDKVYSILPSDGVGDFDFTRGTKATRINAQGLIETVASGENRLNYPLLDGEVVGCPHLLLEPARTNSVTYSENLSELSSQSNVTISLNQVISPDGTLNASSFIDNSVSGVHRAFTNYSSSIASGQLVCHSVFAKAKEHKWFQLSTGGNTNDQWANFDLENGIIGNSSSSANPIIENYGNGWYRCILLATTSATNASLAGLVTLINNLDATTRSPSYVGSNGGVFIFGLQIEQGSYPTSYIKSNSGSATTRAAETCTGSGDAATFNDSEGVLFANISQDNDGFNTISISDGGTSDRITIAYQNNTIKSILVYNNTVKQLESTNYPQNLFHKVAIKYTASNVSLIINGFELLTTSKGAFADSLTTLEFAQGNGGNNFYGKTKQLQYFDTTDIDLEQLTSWDSFRDMAEGQLYTIE